MLGHGNLPPFNNMKIHLLTAFGIFLGVMGAANAQSTLYFNQNGGDWDAAGIWSTDLAGSDSVDWVSGSHAIFGVTGIAITNLGFTTSANQAVASLTKNTASGNYTISSADGATISNATGNVEVTNGILSIGAHITLGGSATLVKTGVGILNFAHQGRYSATALDIQGGTIVWTTTVAYWTSGARIDIGTASAFRLSTRSSSQVETYEIAALSGQGTFVAPTINKTLRINIADAETSNFAGIIDDQTSLEDFAIIKSGLGTQIFSGTEANTQGGLTTVDSGVLALGKTAGVDAIGSGGVVVNADGVLRLDASNQINNASDLTLAGGEFDLQAFSETLGTLILEADSAITLAGGGQDRLLLADSSGEDWSGFTLTIYGVIGADTLRFGIDETGLTGQQLASIIFADYGGVSAQINSAGYVYAIPEPANIWLLGFGLCVLVLFRRKLGGLRLRG